MLLVPVPKTRQIDIEHRISVKHRELFVKLRHNLKNRSGGAPRFAVVQKGDLETCGRCPAAIVGNGFRQMVDEQENFCKAMFLQQAQLMAEQGSSAHVDQRLRQCAASREQAGSFAAREDNCLFQA